MLVNKLPDPHLFIGNSNADFQKNSVIYASTDSEYHYPKHLTPYLFVANFKSTGNYRVNKVPAFINDKFFYFLNAGTELEIRFKHQTQLETLLILFNSQLVNDVAYYQRTTAENLLENCSGPKPIDLYIPQTPFEYTDAITYYLNKLKTTSNTEDQEILLIDLLDNLWLAKGEVKKGLDKLTAKRRITREELHKRLLNAKLFMQDNFNTTLTIECIAKEACLNKFHFLKLFKQYHGSSPHQYLVKIKLKHAFALLETGKFSVFEVCHRIGFESQGTFTNLFKRHYGLLPSQLPKSQFPSFE